MKNVLKVLGIIVLVAVIGFSMAACPTPTSGGGNTGGTTIGSGTDGGSTGGDRTGDDGGSGSEPTPTAPSYFTFNSATGTIIGYSNSGPKDVIIPSSINGVAVTTIGVDAFAEKQLTSVTIPNSVTAIRDRAFINNNPLISVTIGANVAIGFLSFGFRIGGTFVSDFSNAYSNYGKQAGTYTRPNATSTTWTKQASGNIDVIPGDFIFDSATGTITGYTGSGGAVVIPSSINGVAVRAIGNNAFKSNPLTSITIPSGVTSIGNGAFYYCTELTSVTIPESVTSLGAYSFSSGGGGSIVSFQWEYGAFDNCYSLTSVTIPTWLISEFANKFSGYSNLALTITGTGYLTDGAFATTFRQSSNEWTDCSKIISITLGDGIAAIGPNAFSGCSGVTSITLGAGVGSGYETSFNGCNNLEKITVVSANTVFSSLDGILYNKSQTLLRIVPQKLSGEITIPPGITGLDNAFKGRTGLARINITQPNSKYSSVDGVLFDKDKKLLIQYPAKHAGTAYTIPSGVEIIGAYSFEGCTGLTSVTIPNSRKWPESIDVFIDNLNKVIAGIGEITVGFGVYIPSTTMGINDVSTIESYAFIGCNNLTSVTFGGPAIYDHSKYEEQLMMDILALYGPNPNLSNLVQLAIGEFCNSYDRGFYDNAFPQGSSGAGGNALKTTYLTGGAGTYKRTVGGSNWTK